MAPLMVPVPTHQTGYVPREALPSYTTGTSTCRTSVGRSRDRISGQAEIRLTSETGLQCGIAMSWCANGLGTWRRGWAPVA